jgi:TRAP-type C4-dicarboxylate transport system permease small subunit
VQANAETAALQPLEAGAAAYAPSVPGWIKAIDNAVIALLNVMLAVEVILVFVGTMVRTFFHSSTLMGIDEASPLFLVTLAFLGGAVAYSRGQFIAITVLADRAPRAWNEAFKACSEWIVIIVSFLIGGYSIPLLIANAEEKTILLGIGYVWMTLPITVGSALFVVRAGFSLAQRRRPAIAAATGVVWAAVLTFFIFQADLGAHTQLLYALLAALFLGTVAIGVPVGFVLATIGIVCVEAIGSADMMAVVMNAQRGSGGFIFLALPFFILAGFIMERADVGGRIVEFVGSVIGHVRGGLLQVMVVGVYLSSCISGSKAADMATVGLPMNRKLQEHGYEPEERAAILAASAAMAESVPPSIALILLGSATAISTGALFIGGVLPAATIGVLLMITVRVRASFADWKLTPRAPRSEIVRTGRRAILPLMIPVILIGGIVDVRRPLQPGTRPGLPKDQSAQLVVEPDQRIVVERHDFLHCERGDNLFLGVDARGCHDRDRDHDRRFRAHRFSACGDRHHHHHGDDARELRHHRHPGAAPVSSGAATRHRSAAIRNHHDRGVRHRDHPASDRDCALRRLRNQWSADRASEQAAALVPARPVGGTFAGHVRAGDHDRAAQLAQLQILIIDAYEEKRHGFIAMFRILSPCRESGGGHCNT